LRPLAGLRGSQGHYPHQSGLDLRTSYPQSHHMSPQ